MRDICRVIDFLINEVIPVEQRSLIIRLRAIRSITCYIPPELQRRFWQDVGNILFEEAGLPEGEPWKVRLGNVFNDKEKIPESWKPVTLQD